MLIELLLSMPTRGWLKCQQMKQKKRKKVLLILDHQDHFGDTNTPVGPCENGLSHNFAVFNKVSNHCYPEPNQQEESAIIPELID